MDSPAERTHESLQDLLAGVLRRLEDGEPSAPDPRALTRELRRLHDELARARAPEPAEAPSAGARPSSSPSAELIARLAAHTPRQSRYRIEGEIARGGMGAILKAFDPDLRRALAMKVALERPSDDAKQRERIARFLEEAQITGQLDHPGVVPVHELGLDAQGRLYFTMRLVRGRDLGAIYALARAGEEGWSTTRVLGVLLKVCEAMAYAHSKGVIHRDLKPANVMVGGFGEVYAMDWGLAKVVGAADTRDLRVRAPDSAGVGALHSVRTDELAVDPSTPLITMDGTVLGTPAYMSPEQASGAVEAMDARSDVYALGAMLYQLFAGHPPYQDGAEKLDAQRIWLQILRSAPKPLAECAPETPPELIAIVERAMAREMSARYPDMQALADDLRAWLEGRVVRAYESGAIAELRKWVKRNKALASASTAAILAALIGLLATSYVQAQGRRTAELEKGKAQVEAATSQQVTDLLTAMFEKADPKNARGAEITVKEVLDHAAGTIVSELPEQPVVRARLMHTMARVYKSLELHPQAEALLVEALAIRRATLGDEHEETQLALEGLGHLYLLTLEYERARPFQEELLEVRRRTLGGEHRKTLGAMTELAAVYERLGMDAQTERLNLDALEAQRRVLGPTAPDTLQTLSNLAVFYFMRGRTDDARRMLTEVVAAREASGGADDDGTLKAKANLAVVEQEAGRLEEAERLFRAVHEARARLDASDHPNALSAAVALGQCLAAMERWSDAETLLRQTLVDCRRVMGTKRVTREAIYHLARVLTQRGGAAEAELLVRELLDVTPAEDPSRAAYSELAERIENSH